MIRALEPLGARLAAEGCECEDTTEPRHRLGHVLKFVAEALDLVEEGRLEEVTPEDVVVLKHIRDLLVRVL